MEPVLTLPIEVAAQIFNNIISGECRRGVTMQDEQHEWIIGKDIDVHTGVEMLQIHVRPIIAVIRDPARKFSFEEPHG